MSTTDSCRRFDELADELALGVATGEQRATALAHAAECERCSERLARLSATADRLLLLAPEQEPPVGFESALQERFELNRGRGPADHRRRPPSWRVLVPALTAAAAIVVLGAGWISTGDDRQLAADYRQALDEVNGRYFTTFALIGPGSERFGSGFAYEGDPSWVFVTLDAPAEALPSGRYELSVELRGGPAAAPLEVRSGTGSGGVSFPGEIEGLDRVRLRGPGAPIVLSAASAQPIYP